MRKRSQLLFLWNFKLVRYRSGIGNQSDKRHRMAFVGFFLSFQAGSVVISNCKYTIFCYQMDNGSTHFFSIGNHIIRKYSCPNHVHHVLPVQAQARHELSCSIPHIQKHIAPLPNRHLCLHKSTMPPFFLHTPRAKRIYLQAPLL